MKKVLVNGLYTEQKNAEILGRIFGKVYGVLNTELKHFSLEEGADILEELSRQICGTARVYRDAAGPYKRKE